MHGNTLFSYNYHEPLAVHNRDWLENFENCMQNKFKNNLNLLTFYKNPSLYLYNIMHLSTCELIKTHSSESRGQVK